MLGAVFLFAAAMKLPDAEAFALTVMHLFRLDALETATVLTVCLISVEALLGVLFLVNQLVRQIAVVTSGLLAGFIGVQCWLMQTGEACRCFGSLSGGSAGADIVRNIVLMGLCVALIRAQIKTPKGGEPFGA
jgi:uncharacterized membrane protein